MARVTNNILGIRGHLGDWTIANKNGTEYLYPRHTKQPRRLSGDLLAQQVKFTHSDAVWRVMKTIKEVHIEGGKGPYYRFKSVNSENSENNESLKVYLTKEQFAKGFTLLLPETVISDGPLHPIIYRLDELEGVPTLLTDLSVKDAGKGRLLLYTLHQLIITNQRAAEDIPRMKGEVEEVDSTAITEVDGCVALKGERFADPMAGFALVQVVDGHVAQQRIVTNCKYYERFTTEEALQESADSYGGLTGE